MAIDIRLEFTPNPDTLKYVTNTSLLPSGSVNFKNAESAKGQSLLAEKLFEISQVRAVMIGNHFITLTLNSSTYPDTINHTATQIIRQFLESGQTPVKAQKVVPKQKQLTEIEAKIIKILDDEIRPAVAMDGGDIIFEKYEDGFVYLKMQGSCSGCPSAAMTLKMGVETRLREAIPEIQEIIPV